MVEINAIVTEIAASAQEQATGLQQVNTAVNQMDQVTQQNAAMVEETTARLHALAGETEELGRLVGRYQTGQAAEDPIRAQLKKAAPHAYRNAPKKASPVEASAAARAKPEPVRRDCAESRGQRVGIASVRGRPRGRRLAGVLTRVRRIASLWFAAALGFP